MTNETQDTREEVKESNNLENLTLKILNGGFAGSNFFAGRNVTNVVQDAKDIVNYALKMKSTNPKIFGAVCEKYHNLADSYLKQNKKPGDEEIVLTALYQGAYEVLNGLRSIDSWQEDVDREDRSIWKACGVERTYDSVWGKRK